MRLPSSFSQNISITRAIHVQAPHAMSIDKKITGEGKTLFASITGTIPGTVFSLVVSISPVVIRVRTYAVWQQQPKRDSNGNLLRITGIALHSPAQTVCFQLVANDCAKDFPRLVGSGGDQRGGIIPPGL